MSSRLFEAFEYYEKYEGEISADYCGRCGKKIEGGECNCNSSSGSHGSDNESSVPGPIYDNECEKDSDCGEYRVCYGSGTWPFNKKKCRDMSDKEIACVGKKWGSECRYYKFLSTGAAIPVDGTCQTYGASRLGCTTLNSTPGGKK